MGRQSSLPPLSVVTGLITSGKTAGEIALAYRVSDGAVYSLLAEHDLRVRDLRAPVRSSSLNQAPRPHGEWAPPPPWSDDGLCADPDHVPDPDIFYPAKGDLATSRAAKSVCRACPVVGLCLDWAIDHNERLGVWGGTSPRQRDRIRKRRAQAAPEGATA